MHWLVEVEEVELVEEAGTRRKHQAVGRRKSLLAEVGIQQERNCSPGERKDAGYLESMPERMVLVVQRLARRSEACMGLVSSWLG